MKIKMKILGNRHSKQPVNVHDIIVTMKPYPPFKKIDRAYVVSRIERTDAINNTMIIYGYALPRLKGEIVITTLDKVDEYIEKNYIGVYTKDSYEWNKIQNEFEGKV